VIAEIITEAEAAVRCSAFVRQIVIVSCIFCHIVCTHSSQAFPSDASPANRVAQGISYKIEAPASADQYRNPTVDQNYRDADVSANGPKSRVRLILWLVMLSQLALAAAALIVACLFQWKKPNCLPETWQYHRNQLLLMAGAILLLLANPVWCLLSWDEANQPNDPSSPPCAEREVGREGGER